MRVRVAPAPSFASASLVCRPPSWSRSCGRCWHGLHLRSSTGCSESLSGQGPFACSATFLPRQPCRPQAPPVSALHRSFIPTKPGDEERDDSETGKLLPTTAAVGGGGAAAAVTATVSTTAAAHHGANGAAPADANAAAAEKPLPPAVPAKPAASVGFGVHGNMLTSIAHSGFVDCLLMKRKALLKHRLTLRTTVEFGALMCWYFLCDRTTVFGEGEKSYSRDLFVFLFVILTSVAVGSSLQAFKMPLLLNRPQTEEWKGWMQVRRGRGRGGAGRGGGGGKPKLGCWHRQVAACGGMPGRASRWKWREHGDPRAHVS